MYEFKENTDAFMNRNFFNHFKTILAYVGHHYLILKATKNITKFKYNFWENIFNNVRNSMFVLNKEISKFINNVSDFFRISQLLIPVTGCDHYSGQVIKGKRLWPTSLCLHLLLHTSEWVHLSIYPTICLPYHGSNILFWYQFFMVCKQNKSVKFLH